MSIVKQAANQLFQKRPGLVAPGGDAYGNDITATCLRDMAYSCAWSATELWLETPPP